MTESTVSVVARMRTLLRLGPLNILRVAVYRTLLKWGVYRHLLPIKPALVGPFFDWSASTVNPGLPENVDALAWSRDAERVMGGELPVFSSHWVECGFPPNWHRSVISRVELSEPQQHWTRIPDFALTGGDVKGYWEPARFDGLVILALAWISTRRPDFQLAIEHWFASWCKHNPANAGVQWKCGQETALRLLQVILVAELLRRWGAVQPTRSLRKLVAEHCARIAPTMLYGVGQENNHGTSEAGALFAGGAFLVKHGDTSEALRGKTWRRTGRHWLENRLQRLVMPDGSFAQHSVNYHRLMLDTCSFAETTRKIYAEIAFSQGFYERCAAAATWLADMTDPIVGDAPNLGANDGARIFVLHRLPYRDYRPSVQWASILFLQRRKYAKDPQDEVLSWLGLDASTLPLSENTARPRLWPDGGYAKLVSAHAWLILRLPRYRFRPSQSDALHLDLWVRETNLTCDGGSFSYNLSEQWLGYFGGTKSHNTVQFDGRDQMPRISRFLFAEWLDCAEIIVDSSGNSVMAGYRDCWGATHRRAVHLLPEGGCTVVDSVAGFRDRAVLRWRLAPLSSDWVANAGAWNSGTVKIRVSASTPISRLEMVTGWQSKYYGIKSALSVLEVEVRSAATLTTEITW
jgi:hypothetical protein